MRQSEVPSFRAMIIEDQDFQRRVGRQVLQVCGATKIIEAADGANALALLQSPEGGVDILVCDLNMPGMDGLEFLRHIGSQQGASSIILASEMELPILRAAEVMARSYGLNILGTIAKPLSESKLLPLVLGHFGRSVHVPRAKVDLISLDEIIAGITQRQFEPFFQPKVYMRDCTLAGVEALMRWRHPERGLIPPGAFIPVMETHDLISEMTFVIVEAALGCSKRWRAEGLETPIAINFSAHSLKDTTLADRLMQMVAASGLAADSLVIEVTETVAITDLGHSLETLARLRMKGFGLSIDDYGTGFSSMQQLTRVPFSELKIDQMFVTGSSKEEILQALLGTSVTMARQLKLRTVAEGVESELDWKTVARLGCDVAQGYFIGKPMPEDHLIPWYRAWLSSATTPIRASTMESRGNLINTGHGCIGERPRRFAGPASKPIR